MVPSRREMLEVLDRSLFTVETEYTDVPLPVVGELPPGLDGVLFRNGGGRFERGGHRYGHPFDGDGHLVRIEFQPATNEGPATARYTNRFVRTAEFVEEEAAGRMRYRGFGTNLPGGLAANALRLKVKNAANTNVVWHGGRLLALWEGGLPHRLDPMTLATLGPDDFQGRLRDADGGRRRPPALPFAAHPRLDAETGELFNFGVIPGRRNRLACYRVDANGCMDPPRFHALERFSFVHDFALTRRFICVLLPRAEFDLTAVLVGHRTPIGSLKVETDRPMQALLIPRDGGPARLIEAGPGFVFHIAQAFDRDDGTLVMDVIRFRAYPAFDDLADLFADTGADLLPRLERLVLDPAQDGCRSEPWPEPVRERGAELPTTAPGAVGAEHRVIYSLGAPAGRGVPFFTAVQRLDTENGELLETDFGLDLPGEPVLAGAGCGPDADGWLLTLVCRGPERPSQLLVLGSRDLRLQATLTLPHAVPLGFHGCWVERCRLG